MKLLWILLVFVSPAALALNVDAPIDISANSLEVFQTENRAIFKGKVKVTHGKVNLGADKLNVFYSQSGNEDIKEIIATGHVIIIHGDSTATGDKAIYTPKLGHVLITGDVIMTRDGSVLKGEKLVYNIETGHMKLVNPKNKGRVKAIFSLKGKSKSE